MTSQQHLRSAAAGTPSAKAAIRIAPWATAASALALATALAMPGSAHAQAQGSATTVSGFASTSSFGTTTTVTIDSAEAVIDWNTAAPSLAGETTFLPGGSTLSFQSGSSGVNYTVLNRLNTFFSVAGVPVPGTGAVRIDGTVQSRVNGVVGGNVWFYSPTGIIAGAGSTFDVGSLVLTSNAIDTTGGLFGLKGEIRFRGAAGNLAAVTVQPGAQIGASGNGSYVALVAPRITQGGTVNVNGSTAYVAAEQADITINGGLFDINILAGTTDPNGIVHTGTTTGPASTPSPPIDDPQRVYMVGIAKNDALTMLLSGSIGYTPAASVAQEQSAVVLSAGYDVSGGDADIFAPVGVGANISMDSLTFTSRVSALASGAITIQPAGPAVSFQAPASLQAANAITLAVGDFASITAAGDLSLTTGTGTNGGTISLTATGSNLPSSLPGQISVGGLLSLNANASAELGLSPLDGASATGGTISLLADGGSIDTGSLNALATSFSEIGTNSSGNAHGGAISLTARNGGTLNLNDITLDVSASVQFDPSVSPVNGGNAIGGSIDILGESGGGLGFGNVVALAQTTAGTATTGQAGTATQGNIRVNIRDGAQDWLTFRGDITGAAGFASAGGAYGGVQSGTDGIVIDVAGPGALNIGQSVSLYAEALLYGGGGSGTASVRGGSISISPHDGGTFQISQDLFASAVANGSPSLSLDTFAATAPTIGGTIRISASGGTFSSNGSFLNVGTTAKDADATVGSSTGGTITLSATSAGGTRGLIDLGATTFSNYLLADSFGATGLAGSDATGGSVVITATDADINMGGFVTIDTSARSGISTLASGGASGNATGGTVTIETNAGTQGDASLIFGDVQLSSSGIVNPTFEGLLYNSGNGGSGNGGTVTLDIRAGSLTANAISLEAQGIGGASAAAVSPATTPYTAGTGTGGSIAFNLTGGNATLGTVTFDASGIGGEAGSGSSLGTDIPALAGVGRGGSVSFTASAGTLSATSIALGVDATGGMADRATDANSNGGGNATGGTASFTMAAGGTATANAPTITLSASGAGGAAGSAFSTVVPLAALTSGTGGTGTGGQVTLNLAGGALTSSSITVAAGGTGGQGGDNYSAGNGGQGGSAFGGTATVNYLNEGHNISSLAVSAGATGGQAGVAGFISDIGPQGPLYIYSSAQGGRGGAGNGGVANLSVDVDPTFASLTVSTSGVGGTGGNGGSGGVGGVGIGGRGVNGATLTHSFGLLDVTGALSVLSTGTGGAGGNGFSGKGGDGGNGFGGDTTLSVDGANTTLNSTFLTVSSNGFGGAGGTGFGSLLDGARGGNGTGGNALFSASNGATVLFRDATGITAQGFGTPGTYGSGGAAGGGGNGSGGGASLNGGGAAFTLTDATLSMVSSNPQAILFISASGTGGDSIGSAPSGSPGLTGVDGGFGQGGDATFNAVRSRADLLTVVVDGHKAGGQGSSAAGTGGAGGSTFNGSASFLGTDSSLTLAGPLTLDGRGLGGNGGFSPGGDGGAGGIGLGSLLVLSLTNSALTAGNITGNASGTGGAGGLSSLGFGGSGGASGGGTILFTGDGAGTVLQASQVSFSANAIGGDAGNGSVAQAVAREGGSASGGRTFFTLSNGASATLDNLGLSADATGGAGAHGGAGNSAVAGGQGGDGGAGGLAVGGQAQFTIDGGAATLTTFFTSADGFGGAGGTGGDGASGLLSSGGAGGAGGFAGGGFASFDVTNGSVTLGAGLSDNFGIHATGFGGAGGNGGAGGQFSVISGPAGNGGAGGLGGGGNALLNALGGNLLLPETLVEASGFGGLGGIGTIGGAGGAGTGGNASVLFDTGTTATLLGPLTVHADAIGGLAGDSLAGIGLAGGSGTGGTARFTANGAGTLITLADNLVTADGTGGQGAVGIGNGGNGGAGGDGAGGLAAYAVTGGAVVTVATGGISANGLGGQGATGGSGFPPGVGGAGGNGTGGAVQFGVDNARLTIGTTGLESYTMSATGLGGSGGAGGTAGTGGAGGNGGSGSGGSVSFIADTGDYALPAVLMTTLGTGGNGGAGGTGTIAGAAGTLGTGSGGSIAISNLDNGTLATGARRQFQSLQARADNRGTVGAISLTDSSTAANGGLTVIGQLFLSNAGAPANPGVAGIAVRADANRIRTGSFLSNSGFDTTFAFTGNGGIDATNAITAFAVGTLGISHGGQPATPVDSFAAQQVSVTAGGDITAGAGSRLSASDSLFIASFAGRVSAADLRATNDITAQSFGDMLIGNARTTGATSYLGSPLTSGGAITLQAGLGISVPSLAQLGITGTVSASGSLLAQATGSVDIAGTAIVGADNRVQVDAGNNIFVHAGAQIASARNPVGPTGFANPADDPGGLVLGAGDALIDTTTPGYASIRIDGSLSATGRPVVLLAEAIDGSLGSIAASGLYASILRAPAPGAIDPGDDIALAAGCGRGNICLNAIQATNAVQIGPVTGTTNLPNAVSIMGAVNAPDVVIRARDALRFTGTANVNGGTRLYLASLTGNVDTAAGTLLSGQGSLTVFAAGTLNGAGSIIGAGSVGLSLGGGGLSLTRLSAGTTVDTVDANGTVLNAGALALSGALSLGRLDVGLSQTLSAPGITIGQANAGANLLASATNGVTITQGAIAGSLLVSANGATLGTINAGGDISVSANSGGLNAGTLTSGGAIQVDTAAATGGTVDIGTFSAGSFAQILAAGGLTVGTASTAGDLILMSNGGNLTAGNLTAGANLSVSAANGLAITQGAIRGSLSVTANDATLGTITAGGDIAADLRDGGLSAGTLTSGGAVRISSFPATTGGAIAINTLSAGDYAEVLAAGGLTVGTAGATNDLILTSNRGNLTAGNVTAGDDIWISTYGTAPAAVLSIGNVTGTGLGNDGAPSGSATFGTVNGGAGPAGSVIRIRSGGGIVAGNVTGTGRVILVADTGTIASGNLSGPQGVLLFSASDVTTGGITGGPLYVADASMFLPNLPDSYLASSLAGLQPVVTAGSIRFGGPVQVGDMTLATNQNLTLGAPVLAGNVRILANGAVTGAGLTGSGTMSVIGNQGIAFTTLASGGTTALASGNGTVVVGDIASTGAVTAAGRAVTLNAAGPLTIAQARATAGDAIIASAATLAIGSASATGNIQASGAAGIQAANLTATNIDVTSTNGAAALTGPVSASGALRITARGTASFAGQMTAQTITVSSGDIAIATGGALRATGTLALTASDTQRPTFIGGADMTAGYSLSAAEIARLFAGSIAITAPRVAALASASLGSTRAPDVTIGSFTLNAGGTAGNIGPSGTLSITTAGKMRVTGDVRLTGLGANGGLTLVAADALEVIAGSGSIDLRDANGALGGVLTMSSADIIAATSNAIADVAAATTLDARSDRLGQNDAIILDQGMLRAGAIRLQATGGAYIQNVGATTAFADRRGFTANSIDILTLNPQTGGGTAEIVINGQLAGTTGFVTGLDTIPLVSVNGASGGTAGGFAARSTVNGCLLSAPLGCTLRPPTVDNQDILAGELSTDPRQVFEPNFQSSFIELRELPQYGYPPLIDEPVTGAGNDDLWETPTQK